MVKKVKKKYNNSENRRIKLKLYESKNADKIKEKAQKRYQENKDIIKEKNKIYVSKNKERTSKYKKEWEQKDSSKAKKKIYRDENREILGKKGYARKKERLKNDPFYKFKESTRNAVYNSMYRNGYTKNSKTAKILGCTFQEFKEHIEKQFQSWMTWQNYGLYNGTSNYGWDLDHIIPISSAKTEGEVLNLNNYLNFQPLCSYTNRYIKKTMLPL